MNRLSNRFVSSISPSFEAALTSGGSLIGYEPDLMGVAGEGSAKINAPAAAI
jgi:hypothetical protein